MIDSTAELLDIYILDQDHKTVSTSLAMLVDTLHTLVARERECVSVSEECPVTESFYGYAPSNPPNATLLALFGLALIVHSAQAIYYRTWGTFIAFSLGCLSEVIGISRLRSTQQDVVESV